MLKLFIEIFGGLSSAVNGNLVWGCDLRSAHLRQHVGVLNTVRELLIRRLTVGVHVVVDRVDTTLSFIADHEPRRNSVGPLASCTLMLVVLPRTR